MATRVGARTSRCSNTAIPITPRRANASHIAARWRIVPPSPPATSGQPYLDHPAAYSRSISRDMAPTRAAYGRSGRATSSTTWGFATSHASNAAAYERRSPRRPSTSVAGIDNIDVNIENWVRRRNRLAPEMEEQMADGVHRRGPRDELLLEVRGPVRIVTLNRPEALNAANEALHGEIARVWRELDADPETRAIVLTGAGSAFSAGGDLNLLQRMVEDPA